MSDEESEKWWKRVNEDREYATKDLNYVLEMVYCEESEVEYKNEEWVRMGLHEHAAKCRKVSGKRIDEECVTIISEALSSEPETMESGAVGIHEWNCLG
ncbi:hypothetical protein CHS0354_036572 [Potamilus streckersoni]|uniref:Uncharacterized protein n=1 Tax=Potamilus streckersoni TaxID=2493646 RepID=A0AAE0TJ77_9BIVA|nr:hypothetical protein CHS0354_036572 [Potamilus streckersoni]